MKRKGTECEGRTHINANDRRCVETAGTVCPEEANTEERSSCNGRPRYGNTVNQNLAAASYSASWTAEWSRSINASRPTTSE